jgi:hypothetical protein
MNPLRIFYAPDNGSLIDAGGGSGATAGTDDPGTDDPAASTDNPGQGDEPNPADPFGDLKEYQDESGKYLGKYNTIKDVFDGYKNATAKLREKMPEPPESPDAYQFTWSEESGLGDVDLSDDPGWQAMAPVFHEEGISNEKAQRIIEKWLGHQASAQVKPEEIRAGLGAEADRIVNDVQAFVNKANDPDGVGMLGQLAGQNPATLKAFHQLLQQIGEKAIPQTSNGGHLKSWQELEQDAFDYKEKHKATIDSNPTQQKIYEDLLRKSIHAKK